jgi:polysaccharide deacetylase family protein (PEP-CTERM system associated)
MLKLIPTDAVPVSLGQAIPAMSDTADSAARRHVLTVALEDYFQVGAFNQLIQRGQWYRFETRMEKNTERTLDLLDRHGISATFFVLGWIADRYPELVRRVAERGHEIASKGYYHRNVRQMSPAEFREDLARTRAALEKASGTRVLGYRVADDWFAPSDLWALDVLAEEGYAYDSSLAPRLREYAHEPWRRFLHEHHAGDRSIWEFPISTIRLLRWVIPIGGGNYFRQFPHWMVRRAVRRWDRQYQVPFVMYFHVWEIDPDQPIISSASLLTRIRHYRNLHRMESMLEHYFQRYSFTSAARYLHLDTTLPGKQDGTAAPVRKDTHPEIVLNVTDEHTVSGRARTPLTFVVPCYNEELILPYLANTLRSVIASMEKDYELSFVFVNDGSKDGTAEALKRIFGDWPRCVIRHHETNRGVAAAILTGIQSATTELVCSIDCDCTYDPHEAAKMVPLLTEGVDVVTASPYHPDGQVRNVPGWRLFLSKSSSFLYRRVLRQKLYTYTSCFRLYRRSAIVGLNVHEPGFLGVAEILGKLDLKGSRIAEFPAVLEVRMLGRSKLRTLRTILGHLRLMYRLLWLRLLRRGAAPLSPQGPAPVPGTPAVPRQEAPA